MWPVLVLFAVLYFGVAYFYDHSAWGSAQVYAPYCSYEQLQNYQPPAAGGDLARGKAVYENVCGLCHNADGMGKPNQAPPFAGSEWVLGNPNRMIRIPLSGLSGAVTVKGQQWSLAMPAMGATLSDEDLAAVLTYIRQSWGNNASAITPDMIQAVKAEIKGRTQPWSATELNTIQ
jgi:mono/diheme cytochrome c family protein